MLIALNYNVVDIQHRLGHRNPDTTLKIYTHQWKQRDAEQSRIGQHLDALFAEPTPIGACPTAAARH